MTTWTMVQVYQAQGLRAKMVVDVEIIARHGDTARNNAALEMSKVLTRMAHSFAIELSVGDFEVRWSEVEGEPWHTH